MNNVTTAKAIYDFRKIALIHINLLKTKTKAMDKAIKSSFDAKVVERDVREGAGEIINILKSLEDGYKQSTQSLVLTELVAKIKATRLFLEDERNESLSQDPSKFIKSLESITPTMKDIANHLENETAISEIIVKAMEDFCRVMKEVLKLIAKEVVGKVRPDNNEKNKLPKEVVEKVELHNKKEDELPPKAGVSHVEKVNQPNSSRKRQ